MHENGRLLERFYDSIQAHDHRATAACYHPGAAFEDIAFKVHDKKLIHAMWHMISETDLQLTYTIESANDRYGTACWTADYTFRDTGKKVLNHLKSNFTFKDGLIIDQRDDCNPLRWGIQALGPVNGVFSWLFPGKRRRKAMDKLQAFIDRHPQYQSGDAAPLAGSVAIPT